MSIYSSEEGSSFFEVENTNTHKFDQRRNYEFQFKVKARDFSGGLSGVWFYDDDLSDFLRSINDMISGKCEETELRALSDFNLQIKPSDRLGHFFVQFWLIDSIYSNSCNLTVKIGTQSLIDFASQLQTILKAMN